MEYVSRSGINESYSNYILVFWGKCQTVLHIVSALPSPLLSPANTCYFSLDALMIWSDSSLWFSILPWWLKGWESVHVLRCHLYISSKKKNLLKSTGYLKGDWIFVTKSYRTFPFLKSGLVLFFIIESLRFFIMYCYRIFAHCVKMCCWDHCNKELNGQ